MQYNWLMQTSKTVKELHRYNKAIPYIKEKGTLFNLIWKFTEIQKSWQEVKHLTNLSTFSTAIFLGLYPNNLTI